MLNELDGTAIDASRGEMTTTRIRLALPHLSQAHSLIAGYILAHPAATTTLSAAQLSAAVGVSQPSVTRFCQAIGLRSYQELLLGLAHEVGRGYETGHPESVLEGIGPDDPLEQVIATLARLDIDAMRLAARQLDHATLDSAAHAVKGAHRVDVYGAGGSALIALELELRLFRIGIPIRAWTGVHAAATSAALLTEADVALGISASGRTRETLEPMKMAKARGAFTIALTSDPHSPLATSADLHLTAVGAETPYRTASFAARHAQLLVLDILYTRVAQMDHERTQRLVAATSHIAEDSRVRGAH